MQQMTILDCTAWNAAGGGSADAPPEGIEEDGDVELAEVLGEGDHAKGVQAKPQRVALHARVVSCQVPQV